MNAKNAYSKGSINEEQLALSNLFDSAVSPTHLDICVRMNGGWLELNAI